MVEIPGHRQRRLYHHLLPGGGQGHEDEPRQVAQTLIDNMTLEGSYFTSVEIADPAS